MQLRIHVAGEAHDPAELIWQRRLDDVAAVGVGFLTARATPSDQGLESWARGRRRATLRWEGGALPLVITHWCRGDGEMHRVLWGRVAVPRFTDWLRAKPGVNDGSLLVLQREEDESGWEFWGRAAGRPGIAGATPGLEDALEALFPPHACITRPDGRTNQEFLEDVLRHASGRTDQALGWTTVDAEPHPVRIVTPTHPQPVELDADWSRAPNLRPSPKLTFQRSFVLRGRAHVGGVLRALADGDRPGGLARAQDVTQWTSLPGEVLVGGIVGRVLSLTVRISCRPADPVVVRTELEVAVDAPRPAVVEPPLLSGAGALVEGWHADGRLLAVLPVEGSGWTVLGPDGAPDPARPLLVKPLSPKWRGPEAESAGFYPRHLEGDVVEIDGRWGRVPRLLGSPQTRHDSFEEADFVLHANKALLASGDPHMAPADAPGVHLDGPGRVRVGNGPPNEAVFTVQDERATFNQSVWVRDGVHVDE